MRFCDITGHDEVKETLRSLADNDRLPHTLMLTGPQGVGKLNMARAFAQYLHCEHHTDGDSCGVCPTCRQHASLNFPDLHYIYPIVKKGKEGAISADYASEWRDMLSDHEFVSLRLWSERLEAGNTAPTIYVTESEEIIRVASLSSYSADLKIFLIWLPEKMQPATANKLLKILEEPYENTLFLMVSNEPGTILPTILSRTQKIEIKRLNDDEIAGRLMTEKQVETDAAYEAARLAQGSMARALEIVDNDDELASHRELFQTMMRMAYAANGAELKKISEDIAAMGRQKSLRYLDYCLRQIRENFIANLHNPQLNLLSTEEENFSRRFAPFIHIGNVYGMADEFSRAANDIQRNANAKIVCFDLMLRLMQLLRKPKEQ